VQHDLTSSPWATAGESIYANAAYQPVSERTGVLTPGASCGFLA
jgi:hypothetical protein